MRAFVTGDKLDPSLTTVAEALSATGYETHCINCNNPYVTDFTGLDRGFEHVTVAFPWMRRLWFDLRKSRLNKRRETNGAVLTQETDVQASTSPVAVGSTAKRLRWLMTRMFDGGGKLAFAEARRALLRTGDRPAFVYVHLMETHMYYHPPAGHANLFLPDMKGREPWSVNQNPISYLSGDTPMDDLDFEIVEGLYNGAIHYTDELVGRFFDWMTRTGMLDDTIVVFTADHGESFGEHGLLGHGQCVYDTVVHVPLLVWGPVVSTEARGSTVRQVVQNIDLTGSLLEWAGCDHAAMAKQVQGTPLPISASAPRTRDVALSFTVEAFERENIPAQQKLGLLHKAAVAARSETHKLIWNATDPDELYDVEADPGENTNLLGRLPDVEKKLRPHIDAVLPTFEKAREATLERLEGSDAEACDPLVEERLRDLGYIE
ncbi:MAG: sulfatase-like hydrolase/transferase [Planctomycetes bacterium]|nr:sulfatase-like hydrolase/transferase [Planctomycetota bacterium]